MSEEKNISTEEKIKEAARKIFTEKGYAATRTRDIVNEAGINLALLNYYFRSKEKLFEIIMLEKVQQLFGIIIPLLNDEDSTLEFKIEQIAARYVDMLLLNPDLPLFVFSEIKSRPKQFGEKIQADKMLTQSVLIKQFREKRPDLNPLHFAINLLALCIFPFVARPVLQSLEIMDQQSFQTMVGERKKMIPVWLKSMLDAS